MHVVRFFKGRDGESLTDTDLKTYATYATQKRAPPTVARELRELCMALRAVGIEPPKPPQLAKSKPGEKWITPAQFLLLLAQVMPRWRDHIVVYMLLGLSKGELYRVHPEHVDVERNTMRVRGTKAKSRDRPLPMPRAVREIVLRRLRGARDGEPIFERWNPGNADRHLRLAAKRAGLGKLSFNDLRRSFVTLLGRAGKTALELKPLTGHTTTRMIDQVYARMGDGTAAQHIVDVLEDVPEDGRDVQSARTRGAPSWNKGKPRTWGSAARRGREYVANTLLPENKSDAADGGEAEKT